MPSSPSVTAPVAEHHHNGFGLGRCRPRISWRFISMPDVVPAWKQTAYELEITADPARDPQSFLVRSEDSVLVPWPAEPLSSRQTAKVRVRCFGKGEQGDEELPTPWSPQAVLEVGLLAREDWIAHFITASKRFRPDGPLKPLKPRQQFVAPYSADEDPLQPLRFYKQFTLPDFAGGDLNARLYITSLGLFDSYINGHQTTDECMAPGWTSYNHRLGYRVHDVSSILCKGINTLCVEVGEGWYAGRLGIQGGGRFLYGGRDLGLLAQLEIRSNDAKFETVVVSDDTWSCSASAIQSSEIYNGEEYDMRQEDVNWKTEVPTGSDKVVPARLLPWTRATLMAPDAPPVRVIEEIAAVDVFRSRSGKLIVDFGQNLVGKLLIKNVQLPKDGRLTLRHAEVMEHGELGTRPLWSAKCTDTIISSGDPIQEWTPRFTYHGFRYAQVDGWPASSEGDIIERRSITALVMHSDMTRRGFFECSNDWLNKLHSNVVWSMRGNFFSIPTDCPQRADRLGWTGDLNLFCPTATFLFDTNGMLGGWLQDLSAEHLEESRNGIPPLVCPDVLWTSIFSKNFAQAIWDDATVLTPWVLFQSSNDVELLRRQFASMEAWLQHGLPRDSDGLWKKGWQFEHWLDPTEPPGDPHYTQTDGTLVADAFLVHTTEKMAEVCSHLGKQDRAAHYLEDASRLKRAFQRKYISSHGNLMGSTQTAFALAIHFDLYENADQLQVASERLEHLVKAARFHIATGFAGTPVITHALTRLGKPQLAYRMLLEKTCPSWLYPITMGATTVWERWDSMRPDGSINPGATTSFNHYALGAVADWFHNTIGGISPLEPGWKVIKVRPIPGGNLTSATVKFDGPYGMVSCSWRIDSDGKFDMTVIIPPNSTAIVTLPDGTCNPPIPVGSGTHDFSCNCNLGEWPPPPYISLFLPKPTEETIAT